MMPDNPTEIIQRPDAPYELTDEEADEWRAVVGAMPADHFMRGNFALLSQYCRHVIAARRVAQLIGQVLEQGDFDRKEFGALLQLQVTETAAITRLLRSMRLTQQSVLRAETKHPRGPARRPWDPE
ncbi:hypothetical protein [Bradyrhizobium sp. 6(2017)]|uniref:hypothetical protein n=1 Tax=Bradyrhizobium sp. 6(2017) TaxID=1197460 RepID=UPI0013E1CF1F|nr:hypothetical protein [Bradyrhizobium sp. 6(2017)]QIG93486.1 hypothetical protein G6P99_13875 [Bradyrhizobium sp. 6(2017)]